MGRAAPAVCVIDASTYVGFWVLKGLLDRGYTVHAAVQNNGGAEIRRKISELERNGEKIVLFDVDVLDYYSILAALRGCSSVICSLDSSDCYDEKVVDFETRAAINVVEACSQTIGVEKIVFSSSLTAAIWKDNLRSQSDVDERTWSDPHFCRRMKLWHALAKTLSEKAAWALAMDRAMKMVSINPGLVVGPGVAELNSKPSLSYLEGAAHMYQNGVLAFVGVEFLVDVHIRALEDESTCGRYLCFNGVVRTNGEAIKFAQSLSPLISLPEDRNAVDDQQKRLEQPDKLRNHKLNKLVEGTAY